MKGNPSARSGSSEAERMARIVEKGLGNPVARRLLSFVARRRNGQRRAEKILKSYANMEVDLSPGDRVAGFFVARMLDRFTKRMDTTKEEVKESLREGYWRKGLASTLEGLA